MTTRIVAIAGGSASGKTSFAAELAKAGGGEVIALDAYYHPGAHLPPSEREKRNYDHPDALEVSLLIEHLRGLTNGHSVGIPVYDFRSHTRTDETRVVMPKSIVIVEGILALYFAEVRSLVTHSIFVEASDEVRFSRRLARDVRERGRTEASVIAQWNKTVRPMYERYCAPTKCYASEVINGESWGEQEVRAMLRQFSLIQATAEA